MVSKYLLVIHDDSAADTIGRWLDTRRSPESERWTTRLNRTYSLLVVAPDVRDRLSGRSFSTGVAVSGPQRTVDLGAEAGGSGRRGSTAGTTAGSFVRAAWSRDQVRIEHDLFGSVPLFQAHGPGFVALSDSLLVLTDLRARFGLVNTPDEEVLLARSGRTSRTSQHLSTSSIVREITMVAPGRRVVVDCARPLLVDVVGDTFATRLGGADEPLAALRSTAGFLVGSLRALAARRDGLLRVSGGRDSRLLVEALAASGARDGLRVETEADGDAVANAELLGVTVTDEPELRLAGLVPAWAASALGTSDTVLPSDTPAAAAADGLIVVDGIGAKLLGNPWGRQTAAQMAEVATADSRTADAVEAQLRQGIRELGADPDDVDAARWHYAAFRSGVHGASTSAARGVPFHPLQLAESVAAAPIPSHVDARDALSALLRADTPSAARTRDDAEHEARDALSVSELGGPLDDGEVASVTITGTAQGLLRSTVLALEVASARGLGGDERPEVLVETATDLLEVLPVAVREVYEPLAANARWQLLDKRVPVHEAGPGIAKLLALAIFTA